MRDRGRGRSAFERVGPGVARRGNGSVQIGFMLVIQLAAAREQPPRWMAVLLRYQPTARTWSMIEVMMLGVLVALIKIAELATVVPGTALFALGALVFVLAWMQSSFDPREIWERIEWTEAAARRAAAPGYMSEATP